MTTDDMRLRPGHAGDHAHLRALYRDAVLATATPHYDAAQIAAWAGFADDAAAFAAWLAGTRTWLAVVDTDVVVGFAGLETGHDGPLPARQPEPASAYVAALYVAPAHMRRGVATRLLGCVLAAAATQGITHLSTHASAVSRAVFERHDFELVEIQHSQHGGVDFPRYFMHRGGPASRAATRLV